MSDVSLMNYKYPLHPDVRLWNISHPKLPVFVVYSAGFPENSFQFICVMHNVPLLRLSLKEVMKENNKLKEV